MVSELTQLKAFIEKQGWADFGVITFSDLKPVLEKHHQIFEQWLSRGFQADMNYLEKMKNDRYHPENKLSDVKSVIVLQAWYGSKTEGNVARYARGKDYHKVLKKKLLALSDWLKERKSGIETYVSVDSGPTVDRVLAEAAGLGFFGKNSNLIDPSKGSYFFIAILMTNADLLPTEKRRMPTCGDCRKCMSACPTGAIVAPGIIDARRCIAYLTIENKGGIPRELRPMIGNRLFGCDICQEVCPFSEEWAGRQKIRIDELKNENGVGESLDLSAILSIETDAEFLVRFAGTPLMRARRHGLLRNACIVAGNSGDVSFIPLLRELADREEDSMIMEHALWAIKTIEKQST